MSPLRVVIAGGGTGGHLYPGIAVARELLARRPDAVVTFAGTARGLEARVVPREGFQLDVLRSADAEAGAKPIVRAHASAAGDLPIADEGAFTDIDTREDYEKHVKSQV